MGYDPDGKIVKWLADKWKKGWAEMKKAFVVETGIGKGGSIGVGKFINIGTYHEVTKGKKNGVKYENITVKGSITAFGFGASKTITHPYPLDDNEPGWQKKGPLDTQAVVSCPLSKSKWEGEFPIASVETWDNATHFIGIDLNLYTPFGGGRIKIGWEW